MRRILWLIAATVAFAVPPTVPALAGGGGGGGCSQPPTSAAGAVVEMRGACFSPTVLHVRPGTTVTFVNRDEFEHNVIGANWRWGRFRGLRLDASLTRTFQRPGVFPYACSFHPGMMGAVVVGRGDASDEVAPSPEPEPAPSPADGKAALPVAPDREEEAGWRPWALVPWGASAAGIGYGIAQRRRGRRA